MRLVVCLAMLLCLAGGAARAKEKTVTLSVGGYDRTYTYHLSGDTKGRLPVVLVLPDSGVSGADALAQYRWATLADAKGFVAVGLDALPVEPSKAEMFQTNPSFWSDGSGRGNAYRGHLDDAAFVRAVLDDLDDRVSIDPKRIYATGLGNGGSMANELAVRMSSRLAAIAPVAGHLWDTDKPANPLSVLLMYGTDDTVDPLAGGVGLNAWTHGMEKRPAVLDTVKAWAAALGCGGEPAVTKSDAMLNSLWKDCASGAGLEYVVIPAQGHHWPGGVDDQMASLGPNSRFDATGFIWAWFQAHPKP